MTVANRPRPRRAARLKRDVDERVRDGMTRQIVLCGESIPYQLVRARRQSIGMQVHLEGLTVRAPRWVTIREIEVALKERAGWIVKTLVEWRGRRREALPRVWKSGAPILYRGRELVLELFPARRPAMVADLFHLTVRHPASHDEQEVAFAVGSWLKDEAWNLVVTRVADYARHTARPPLSVSLSDARGEWGSCNAKGEIRLNWRLVQLPPALAEYVVAHEVAHLDELNHSARFWSLVESLLPGHAALRRELDEWTALLA
ncbi:MAG: SprT family zinc-dependent metalloprotease [Casimicrobiaceae bacterium]